MNEKRKNQAKVIRWARKLHRSTGIFLFVFIFIIGFTGILLGWKKNSSGLILPHTQKGSSSIVQEWLPLDSLMILAETAIREKVPGEISIDRIDIRPSQGIAKVLIDKDNFSVQIDGKSGKILQIQRRYSDFIENIHDGSIIDDFLGIKKGWFKLFYTSLMGLSLMLFCISGFWLWYGPRRMRRTR